MRIVFFGSGEFGVPTLEALCEGHDVVLVVTQPDRPAGRNRKLTATPIGAWAEGRDLPVLKPEKVNAPEILAAVREAEADANVVVAFGQKIGQALIESPKLGAAATVNLHASLLPKYRGAAPIQHCLMQSDHVSGNTVFSLVEKMDAGAILGTQRTPIDPMETAGELHDRLSWMGPKLVLQVLDDLETGVAKGVQQDESEATLAPKLSKSDGWVDLAGKADVVRWRVNGLTPWPGVALRWVEGAKLAGQTFRICKVATLGFKKHDLPIGHVDERGMVATGQGLVRLMEVQPPGKRPMSWEEYVRGRKPDVGDRVESAVPVQTDL